MLKLNHWRDYLLLMRLHKPIGIYLLLWHTLWAVWIAGTGQPAWHIVVIFVLGVVLMRSAGCVINDYADRNIDRHVQRTRDRPLTAGRIQGREALTLFALLCLLAFSLVLFLNWLTILLSLVAVALAALYPFMKRYTYLPQVFLGAAFAWSIPMAFAAQLNTIPLIAWLLLLITLLWTVAYDTLYAMVDREDDLKIGVKSTAILFGDADRFIVGILQALVIALLIVVALWQEFGWWYWLGVGLMAGTFVYQQWLIRERNQTACFQAFTNNHYSGLVIFVGIVMDLSF